MTASLADPPEVVGIRNVLRARWKALPFWYRVAVTVGIELLVAIGLYFVDRSLGYAVATAAALLWLRRVPPLPWRLAGELVLISIFLIAGVRSLAAALAIAFAVFWVPPRYRTWVLPVVAITLAVLYPFYAAKMFVIPVFGVWPDVATGVYMLVFIMMAVGLNIVVGYAGLLDLGYVAFYAMGAYTACPGARSRPRTEPSSKLQPLSALHRLQQPADAGLPTSTRRSSRERRRRRPREAGLSSGRCRHRLGRTAETL
jgi:hypothetical protein